MAVRKKTDKDKKKAPAVTAKKKDATKKAPSKKAKKPSTRGKDPYKATSEIKPARAKKKPVRPATVKENDHVDPAALERGDNPMSLIDHLDEFRSRFIVSLITIVVITLGAFFFSDYLLDVLNRPYLATGQKLNVFNLIDGFLLRLKSAFIAGILLGFPVIIYEIWKYIVPAIDKKDRFFSRMSLIAAVLLFYTGITLTYFALPFAVKALLAFTPTDMVNTINANQYLSFVLLFCLAMGAVFELPIIVMVLTKLGFVSPSFLISKRKYAIVLIWILAAIITPTVDPLTQSLVAVPLMLLYELSIIISRVMVVRKKKRELAASQN
ncbi:MAG TPA: twin-arginine translocase subunit TatC [Spirochaetes bacterium]|nr:twin-arginine translocase subunit TatC [Spirochaetota bacterium]